MKQTKHRNGRGKAEFFRLLSVFVTLCLVTGLVPSQSIAYALDEVQGAPAATMPATGEEPGAADEASEGQEDKQSQATDGAQATDDVQPADDDQSVADAQPTDDVQPADGAQPMEDGATGKDDPAGAVDEQQDGADADGVASAQKTIMAAPRLKGGPLKAPSNNPDDPVAIEGKGTYASLAAALADAADGDTISVTGDVTEPGSVTVSKSVTIVAKDSAKTVTTNGDITVQAGKAVTIGSAGAPLTFSGKGGIVSYGDLTIQPDVTVEHTGNSGNALWITGNTSTATINGGSFSSKNPALAVRGGAKVNLIKSATFYSTGASGSAAYTDDEGSRIETIQDSTFTCEASKGHGLFIRRDSSVGTITGSKFVGGYDGDDGLSYGILVYIDGTLGSISNSTAIGGRGIMVWAGNLTTVSNCTATGRSVTGEENYSIGLQIEIYEGKKPNVAIEGGTYTGGDFGVFNVGGTISVSDATIEGTYGFYNYRNVNGESYCTQIKGCDITGYQAGIVNRGVIDTISGGTVFGGDHTKYDGNSAINNGGTIGTIENVACTSDYSGLVNTSSGTITTIKGGSFKNTGVTVSNSTEGEAAISNAGAITTIDGPECVGRNKTIYNDGSIETITGEGSYELNSRENYGGDGAIYNDENGTIKTVESGTFTASDGATVVDNHGKITEIKGGTYTDGSEDWTCSQMVYNHEGATIGTISGGTFTGYNQEIYNVGSIGEISGGTFKNSYEDATVYNSSDGTITTISGGAFENQDTDSDSSKVLGNSGTIDTINGGSFKGNAVALWNGVYDPGLIKTISGGAFTGGSYGILNKSTINTITGGTITSENNYALENWKGTVGAITVANEGDLVIKGGKEAVDELGGSVGKIEGHGIFIAGTSPYMNAVASAGNIESTGAMSLDTTGDNPGYGRYLATGSLAINKYANGTLPKGYHMSKTTTSVEGQDGDFHFLVKDGTVIYDGNGHELTDPSKAAPGFPNRVFTTDNKAADNKSGFEFAAGDELFNGWNTKADGSGDAYKAGDKLTVPEGEELILYAQWRSKDSKISYDANGGEGETPDTEGNIGDVVEVAESGFEREGHTFVGWNTEPDGSGDAYQPGDDFTLVPDGTTLYAQWEANVYTITFDPNGGVVEGSAEPVSTDYEWGTEITIPEASREGYDLLFWKGSEYQPGDTYTVIEDHTFVAQWEKSEEPKPSPKPEPSKPSKPAKPGKPAAKKAIPQTGDPAAAMPLALFASLGLGLLLAAAIRRRRA